MSDQIPGLGDLDPLLGTRLADRYEIEQKLGEGGMGTVYRARHITLDKEVALKVLRPEFACKEDLVQRFLQEAKAASRIRHQNVIDITDFGATEQGVVFFAMELLDGQDLHDLLTRARINDEVIPWSRLEPVFLQVCAALSAAHAKGIVHRDLKPENIFLVRWAGQDDFVKLLDFGIAKMTELESTGGELERKLTKTGMIFGTPEFMSPEQAKGELADHRADVYALGCILYQMLCGRVPFTAETFMGILGKHMSEEVPALDGWYSQSGAHRSLEKVVRRALAKDREDRHQSSAELAQAVVDAAVGGTAVLPPATRPAEEPQSPGAGKRTRTRWTGSADLPEQEPELSADRSSRAPLVLLLLLVFAAGGGLAAYLVTRGGAESPASSPEPVEANETAPLTPTTSGPEEKTGVADSPTEAAEAAEPEEAAPTPTEDSKPAGGGRRGNKKSDEQTAAAAGKDTGPAATDKETAADDRTADGPATDPGAGDGDGEDESDIKLKDFPDTP